MQLMCEDYNILHSSVIDKECTGCVYVTVAVYATHILLICGSRLDPSTLFCIFRTKFEL